MDTYYNYTESVSPTHPFSYSHIWTYIHSQNENSFFEWQDGRNEIFCAGKSVGKSPPSFISNDYFCESGSKYNNSSTRTLVWNSILKILH